MKNEEALPEHMAMKAAPEEVPSLPPAEVEKHNALVDAYPTFGPDDPRHQELDASQKRIDAARSPLQ